MQESAQRSAATPQDTKADPQRSLAEAAAKGTPVEAGNALRALDTQNDGNRAATNAQVEAQKTSSVANGVYSATQSVSTTTRSVDGVEAVTDERKQTISVNNKSASISNTTTRTATTQEYDDAGKAVHSDPATGTPAETVQSRSQQTSTKSIDANGISATKSVSEQRGSYGVGAESKTSLGEKGVTTGGTVSGNIGDLNAKANGGITANSQGVTISGGLNVNAGPIGVQTSVEQVSQTGLTRTTTVTSAKIGTVPGTPVTAAVEYKQTNVSQARHNLDGTVTYDVTGETKVGGTVGIDAKQTKVDASLTTGYRTVHSITVAKDVNVTTIDPTKPASWPAGTRVTMKSEDFNANTLSASYQNVGLTLSQESSLGTTVSIEKQADNTVSVTAGPTAGFLSNGKLSADLAGFGAQIGVENKTSISAFSSFNLDLDAPAAQKALSEVLSGQKPPQASTVGVSNFATTNTLTNNYNLSAQLNTPLGPLGLGRKVNDQNVTTTLADGSVTFSDTFDPNADGKPELTISGAMVNDVAVERTFSFHLKAADEQDVQTLQATTGNMGIKVGDTVNVSLTEAQLQDLRLGNRPAETTLHERQFSNAALAENITLTGSTQGMATQLASMLSANRFGDHASPAQMFDSSATMPGTITVTR
ncbi:hypothetical protein [Sphingomonas psychrotolerans]|uniref:hypothetical protein n=1 Tax=Sphingomonas psychrotolerans TaxID=1327635 RepID=UPI0013051066|nr:hypothetical protein [Sphingomonas psychrotolerans]